MSAKAENPLADVVTCAGCGHTIRRAFATTVLFIEGDMHITPRVRYRYYTGSCTPRYEVVYRSSDGSRHFYQILGNYSHPDYQDKTIILSTEYTEDGRLFVPPPDEPKSSPPQGGSE